MPSTKIVEKRMGMPEIRTKAQGIGIIPGKMKKADLIHAIQVAEGCQPCFGRSGGQCPHTNCCFMSDCLKTKL
jgi:hypothetical protein